MKTFNTYSLEEAKKSKVKINPRLEDIKEADHWHPDPEQDRKLSDRGAKLRAREDSAHKPKPAANSKTLRPGESYMDYAKRHGYKSSPKKEGLRDKLKRKLGLKNSFEPEGEVLESAVPGKPAERLGAVTAIPQSERDAAKARLLAKTAAKRKEMEKVKEELEIEEGVRPTPIEKPLDKAAFKKRRKSLKGYEQRGDAKKRGHVGKEWYNSGRTYSPDEAKRSRANMSDEERRTRHRSAVDPDDDRDENHYSADKTKNPKKQRKQSAMGEMMSFSQFVESRRMDREGADRGDSGRAERAAKAKASLEARAKRQKVLDKHEKQTGNKLDISRSKEGKEHAKNHPGSRQQPKQRGAKESPLETHNRRVNRHNQRVIKHGFTSKEKRDNAAMAKHTSRFD